MLKRILTGLLLFNSAVIIAQEAPAEKQGRSLPAVNVKTLNGQNFNTADIANDGKPVIISFWATWCSPCTKELNAIAEVYDEWQEETGVKLIAVSIDDARNMNKGAPYVNGRGWEFEVYIDPNQDFKRAMNVNNVPHTFLLNGKGEIVWQHNSYAEGDELKLLECVKKVSSGEQPESH